MTSPKEKTKEAPEWLKLVVRWIFLIVGVPSLTYIFLFISIQHTFETVTTGWQIFIGLGMFIILIVYFYLSIKYLVEETKDYFS